MGEFALVPDMNASLIDNPHAGRKTIKAGDIKLAAK
jgi:histone H3/H4